MSGYVMVRLPGEQGDEGSEVADGWRTIDSVPCDEWVVCVAIDGEVNVPKIDRHRRDELIKAWGWTYWHPLPQAPTAPPTEPLAEQPCEHRRWSLRDNRETRCLDCNYLIPSDTVSGAGLTAGDLHDIADHPWGEEATDFCDRDGIVRSGEFHHGRDYPCTGSVHLGSNEIRCSNPIHDEPQAPSVVPSGGEGPYSVQPNPLGIDRDLNVNEWLVVGPGDVAIGGSYRERSVARVGCDCANTARHTGRTRSDESVAELIAAAKWIVGEVKDRRQGGVSLDGAVTPGHPQGLDISRLTAALAAVENGEGDK